MVLIRWGGTHQHHLLCEPRFWPDETERRKKRKPWTVLVHHEQDL